MSDYKNLIEKIAKQNTTDETEFWNDRLKPTLKRGLAEIGATAAGAGGTALLTKNPMLASVSGAVTGLGTGAYLNDKALRKKSKQLLGRDATTNERLYSTVGKPLAGLAISPPTAGVGTIASIFTTPESQVKRRLRAKKDGVNDEGLYFWNDKHRRSEQSKSASQVHYELEIEKKAARAWKANIGNLSEEAVNKLTSSGVFNKVKELKGLNLGTNKILQANNAKNIKTPAKATAHSLQSLKENMPAMLKGNDMYSEKEMYSAIKGNLENMSMFGTPAANHSKWGKSGLTSVNKHPNKQSSQAINDVIAQNRKWGVDMKYLPKFKRNDREGKKWADAILRRHEADEVRYGAKSLRNKKKHAVSKDDITYPLTTFAGHLNPKILANESANVALAPKSTKNYMNSIRGIYGEVDALKEFGGINYGKSGLYNKAGGNRAERKTISQTKQNFKDMGII